MTTNGENGTTTTNGRHVDGNKRYSRCNIAEDHAFVNPGHSVGVIRDIRTGDNGEPIFIMRVWCIGTPEAYMNDAKDCDYIEEFDLP